MIQYGNSLNDLDLETSNNSTFRYPNTTSCIVEFIEDQLGCSPNIIGSNKKSPRLPCETTSQLTEMAKLSRSLDEADDTAIYEMTGDVWMERLIKKLIRGHPYMTSALRGGGGLAQKKM